MRNTITFSWVYIPFQLFHSSLLLYRKSLQRCCLYTQTSIPWLPLTTKGTPTRLIHVMHQQNYCYSSKTCQWPPGCYVSGLHTLTFLLSFFGLQTLHDSKYHLCGVVQHVPPQHRPVSWNSPKPRHPVVFRISCLWCPLCISKSNSQASTHLQDSFHKDFLQFHPWIPPFFSMLRSTNLGSFPFHTFYMQIIWESFQKQNKSKQFSSPHYSHPRCRVITSHDDS